MFSRDNKEMSKRTRSPSSSPGSSPTPTLDLTRKPIVLRYNSAFFETSSMISLNDDESSSPPPVDQLSRTSFFPDSRINLSGSRNSLTRVSEHTLNTKDSWASDSNPSFLIASDIPFSPSPICSTASSEVIPLLSQQFQMNPLISNCKQEIVKEEEKIVTRTRSSIGSTDGLSVKNNSYTKGKSVRTPRSRKLFSCEEPSTISNCSATTDNYYDSHSVSNSPMVLRNVGKQSDKTPVGYPRSVPKDRSSLSTYRDLDNPREFMKQKRKRYFCNLLPGIRQRQVEVKLDDQKEAKSTEGRRYFHDFISRIWKRKDKKLDDWKEAISAELYNILRKKEEAIDASLSKNINLAKKIMRETEEKIESEKLKAEVKMRRKIASAEKIADDLKAKERQLRDKKISKAVGKRSWWKSLFDR